MIWLPGRMRRWFIAAGLAVVAVAVVATMGSDQFELPSADGPRRVRQAVVAFGPCILAPVLIDRLSGFSATLARERILRRVDQAILIGGMALALVPGWLDAGMGKSAYEVCIATLMTAWTLAAVTRWGLAGLLTSVAVGMAWMLAGGMLASALGFDDCSGMIGTGSCMAPTPLARSMVAAGFLTLVAAVALANSPRWFGTDPSNT